MNTKPTPPKVEAFKAWRQREHYHLDAQELSPLTWDSYISLLRAAFNAGWEARKVASYEAAYYDTTCTCGGCGRRMERGRKCPTCNWPYPKKIEGENT